MERKQAISQEKLKLLFSLSHDQIIFDFREVESLLANICFAIYGVDLNNGYTEISYISFHRVAQAAL